MIGNDGWLRYCIWEHSSTVKALYAQRCRQEVEEMTCHAQAAELLSPHVCPGDSLLDVGCGSGYFFHALQRRKIPVQYCGVDAAPSLIAIGREIMPDYGLESDRLQVLRIEDLSGEFDHIVCINVLSNIDNFHRPLERLLQCARKTVILRESCKNVAEYRYVRDRYLDEGVNLKVYVNTYNCQELLEFIESYGFLASMEQDRYTQGKPESVIDYLHYWQFVVARRAIPNL